jgi:hypothetical protein
MNNLELINFRTPAAMKKQFQQTCLLHNQQMTSVLNTFIADFITKYQPAEDASTYVE